MHSGGKFEEIKHTKIHDEYQFRTSSCTHRSIILTSIGKKSTLVDIFPWKIYFSMIFDIRFCENPRFRDKFQALVITIFTAHILCSVLRALESLFLPVIAFVLISCAIP